MKFDVKNEMAQRYFKSISWCNLRVVLLKIHANYDWNMSNMVAVQNTKPLNITNPNCPIVDIYLLDDEDNFFLNIPTETYRENVMKNGFYIGHHFGSPSRIYEKDLNCFILQSDNSDRIIWSYITKYLLTIYCDQLNLLHLKAAAIEHDKRLFLVCGRGGHGKTVFVESICKDNKDVHYFSNTHVLVNESGYGISIPSNIRYRQEYKKEKYIPSAIFHDIKILNDTFPIDGIFWIDYTDTKTSHVVTIDSKYVFAMMYHFSAAIGNWELKEDVCDYSDGFVTAAEMFIREHDRLLQLLKKTPFYLVSNIREKSIFNETLKIIRREK